VSTEQLGAPTSADITNDGGQFANLFRAYLRPRLRFPLELIGRTTVGGGQVATTNWRGECDGNC
jgi:hypothetical protein